MDNESFVPDNIPADLDKSWHIPRPTLARSSESSQGSTSSKRSTQSVRSGSLLLTAANLAQIHQSQQESERISNSLSTRDQNIQYYLEQSSKDNNVLASLPKISKNAEQDNISVASSMHFTVVNLNTRQKQPKRSCCRRHQLTILIMTMSVLFTLGILTAIFLLEMRTKNRNH